MRNIVLIILLAAFVNAQQTNYKFCAPVETVQESACIALKKGDSEVSCLRVADSAECSIRLAQGEADFGIFNAEELLLTYPFYDNIMPIHQLRHRDRLGEIFEFETVAVVHADLTQGIKPPGTGFDSLKNGGLCHPGFSKSQWWNDYILKYFEKTVSSRQCQDNVMVVENELRNIKNFFGKACRPGEWALERSVDQELKKKYPELCALCDNKVNCTYNSEENHGHRGALECLTKNPNAVAYVALSYARKYLKNNNTFQFLCPTGDRLPFDTPNPCAWIQQPWSVVAARTEIADTLKLKLYDWLKRDAKENWKMTLREIIEEDSSVVDIQGKLSIAGYLSKGREIDLTNIQTCEKRTIRWCTIGDMETNKCKWVARATMALGIEPHISCVQTNSVFQCLRNITKQHADIITIDSNYGYMARKVYGLSTVLYCDTEIDKSSTVIAVVRQQSNNNYPIKSFHDLKDRTACFPEYAGISWLSFVNTARKMGIISSKSCDYPLLVSKLFSGACTPGIKDHDHSHTIAATDVSNKLCSACMRSNNMNVTIIGNNTYSCAANYSNRYYHDKGAIRCLDEGAGDVAFVEAGNIISRRIDPMNYRVLCKNGNLAVTPGFVINDTCALSITIDSEIVGRKDDSQTFTRDILLAFLKMEEWLGYRANSRRPIHVYGIFNGTYDLLFKDSTSGLVSTSSTQKTVEAYKELFSHVYQCSTGHLTATANYIFVVLVALYHVLPSHI
ncbi:transferrin-like [Odontomachus brunneus]|uniref:transferrin-like n=1 Tax=Odontomachus brunneus TaxID=486640 RepID=UPI0013F23A4D|nr:transferrin-like [Odontomachus brunneus]